MNADGLTLLDLPPDLELVCQTGHENFLRGHGLTSFQLTIKYAPISTVGMPHRYSLEISCGECSSTHMRYVTETPVMDLKPRLERVLESHHRLQQTRPEHA